MDEEELLTESGMLASALAAYSSLTIASSPSIAAT